VGCQGNFETLAVLEPIVQSIWSISLELEVQHSEVAVGMTEDSVEQMLILAERLREANGGDLDESAIQAVAEATGAPLEYVRLAIKLRSEKEKNSFLANVRSQFRTLEPHTRRFLFSGAAAMAAAFLCTVDESMSQIARFNQASGYGICTMLGTLCAAFGIYNVFLSRDTKTAALSGGMLAGGLYLMRSVFEVVLRAPSQIDSAFFLPAIAVGALGGALLVHYGDKYRARLGLKDPLKERQDLLKQLNNLQDKLSSGMQFMTFLSVDIVGSTRMKEIADPLAVEYTFNEYHEFVARVAHKYGGRVHSTAGDGMTCAFEHPQHAFAAAKNIQAGIIELNMLRNRIGSPIVLRCGIHVGQVMTPEGGDVKAVNFSHVIDVASHLQKVAPPGGIAVSDSAVAQIAGGASTVGAQRVRAADTDALVWIPRSNERPASSIVLPPSPAPDPS
jgi:class 3 adenylate cyclase